jgi:transcriptional regulator with XRE-family HTH domain
MFVPVKGEARPASELARVRQLLASGLSDYEIARRTGIPRSTVLNWRHGRGVAADRPRTSADRCQDCGATHSLEELDREAYSYLLGEYLGDGVSGDRSGRGRAYSESRATRNTTESSPSVAVRSRLSAAASRTFAITRRAASPPSLRTGVPGHVCFVSTVRGVSIIVGSSLLPGSSQSSKPTPSRSCVALSLRTDGEG